MDCQVTIYTRVYNTEEFLPQCLESVVNQTYRNFQHLIIDNGCTDGCTEILNDYAKNHSWVKLIRFEKNQYSIDNSKWINTPYFAVLDSDDWWDPDYLERLISFLEENDLDLAVTGTMQYIQKQGVSQVMRKLAQPVVLTQRQFAQNYPQLWTFPSTAWATIQKTSIYKGTDFSGTLGLAYGGDTMQILKYIEHCSRIGIDSSALYHYRIHPKGMTYQYDPRRFDANIAIYEQIKNFLETHHTFDAPKQDWLKRVHLSSMAVTLGLLRDAHIPADEKLAECVRIIEHPLTAAALTSDCGEREQWFSVIWEIVFSAMAEETLVDVEKLHSLLRLLAPRCCGAVQAGNPGLFTREPGLLDALRKDDWGQMVRQVMELIVQKRYSKQFDLGQTLGSLIPAKTPLQGMTDTRFFREYSEVCMLVLSEDYSAALEQMTGLLLEQKKLYAKEVFLELYLSLSALEEQVPAFLFGKMQLAWLCLNQGRREECQALADELTEMGLDSEELSELRRALDEQP